jgi:hypothetical protein
VVEVARRHVGVGVHVRAPGEAGELHLARAAHALADRLRGLAGAPVRQLAKGDGGDLHVQVDAVEERAADAGHVALHSLG